MSQSVLSSYLRPSLRFIRRNGGKVALFTIAAGSAVAATVYLRRQFSIVNTSLEEERAAGARKLRAAFIANTQTVQIAFRTLLPLVKDVLSRSELTDSSAALAKLRLKPKDKAEKHELWEQVKLASMTHLVSAIYLASVLHGVLSLQMNLLARYTQSSMDAPVQPLPGGVLSADSSKQYLDRARSVITCHRTMSAIVENIYDTVKGNIQGVGLAERVGLAETENLLVNILSAIDDDNATSDEGDATESDFPRNEFSLSSPQQWLFSHPSAELSSRIEDANYNWLIKESLDLCEILDFQSVLSNNMYIALSYALDCLKSDFSSATSELPFAHLLARFDSLASTLLMTTADEIASEEGNVSPMARDALEQRLTRSDDSARFAASVFLSGEKENTRSYQRHDRRAANVVPESPNAVHPLVTDVTEAGEATSSGNLGLMFDLT